MEFILTNLWGNCARLYAYLNNQGGKTTDSTSDRAWGAIGKFAVRFNRILTVVGIYNSVSNSGNSTNNFDDDNTYTNNEVKFKFYRHAYIAIGI